MAITFTVTAASEKVPLDAKGTGDIAFTVSNKSGRSVRGRVKVVPQAPAIKSWLALVGDVEQDFLPGRTQQVTVRVTVPPGSAEGTYAFRLDCVSVEQPDEDYTQGPTVSFPVAKPKEKPKPFPWWIPVAAALLLGAVGVSVWLYERGRVDVPNVTGQTLVAASAALAPLNLKIGTVTNVLGDPTNVDKVLSQSPAAAQSVASGSAVNVQVGVAIVTVPAITGLAYNAAVSTLQAADLDIGQVTNVNTPGAAGGAVVSVTPPAGNSVQSHTTINLSVQEQNVPVPNVVGQPFPAAVATLATANLKLGTVTGSIYQVVNGITLPSNPASVTSQNPPTGSVPIGTPINLVFPNSGVVFNPLVVNQQAKIAHW
ncbi:MAG TPA: PASTA domain-containing protein [Terriglobia bacterium]|nr:PASTA domain-containing protein [Terriglobia bacterium]